MSQTKNLEVRVGLVTLIAIAALIGGILWGKGGGINLDRQRIAILFPNASGVSSGTQVNVHGVKKGSVVSIDALESGARVTVLVDRDVMLRSDASAAIQVLEITGGKKIELYPGQAPDKLAKGENIPGVNQGDIGGMIASANALAEQVGPLLAQVDSALASITSVIGDPRFQANVATAVENFADAGGELRSLLQRNKGKVEQVLQNVDVLTMELRSVVDENAPAISRVLHATDTLMGDARVVIGNAGETLQRVDRLASRFDSITSDLKNGKGTVSRLLYDEELAQELERAMVALRKTLQDLNQKGMNVNVGLGHKK